MDLYPFMKCSMMQVYADGGEFGGVPMVHWAYAAGAFFLGVILGLLFAVLMVASSNRGDDK